MVKRVEKENRSKVRKKSKDVYRFTVTINIKYVALKRITSNNNNYVKHLPGILKGWYIHTLTNWLLEASILR
jgi:hypothetical protein